MAVRDDYLIKCPFYRIEKRVNNYYRISCEPPLGVISLSLAFDKASLKDWKVRHCRSISGYQECPIAQMYLDE